jgi:PAS domain S-box-containing protein
MRQRHSREWLVMLVALVVLGAGLVLWRVAEQRSLIDAENGRLRALSTILVKDISTNLRAIDRALTGLIRDRLTIEGAVSTPDPHMPLRLRALVEAMPSVRGMIITDNRGTVIAAFPTDLIGRNFAQRPYFTVPSKVGDPNELYLSAPFRSIRGDVVVTATRVVQGSTGQFAGVVLAILDPAAFGDDLRAALYAPDLRAILAHSTGGVFINAGLVGPGRVDAAPQLRQIAALAPGVRTDSTMTLELRRPLATILAPMNLQMNALLVLYVLLVCASIAALGWSQSRRRRLREIEDERYYERTDAAARAASELRFRTLIEEAPIAVAMLRQGHFIYTNRRYNLLHGHSANQDMNGWPWRAMITPASLATLHEEQALIDSDSPRELRFEAIGLGKGGTAVPVFKATTRVELGDGPATLIFVQDISAQKLAESGLLEARDAAQAANRSKAEFLANMSHEIRTPLNAILGLAYLLERANRNRDARAMLQKIRASGRSLLGIINDILDVSKIEAGAMTIERSWFVLRDVLDNVAATMGVAVGERHIDLVIHPLPAAVASVLGDALRVEQVLLNLVSNAIKFTEHGSVEVEIAARDRDDGQVDLLFEVRDTGIGIALAQQDAVFAPFTQADSSTTRRFGGTGLGLTICKRIVEMMDGTIGLRSKPGAGSTFWFSIPVRASTASELYSSPEMVGLTLFVARDGEYPPIASDTADQLCWQLHNLASVEATAGAVEELAPDQLPGAVILPWHDDGAATLAAARRIRATVPADACPVLVLTSTFQAAELHDAATLGVIDAVLTRPVTASTLYNAIIEARKKRALGDAGEYVAASTGCELAGLRILVVDDSEINRDVALRILAEEGAEVILAENGRMAVDWLIGDAGPVDLVLMDVQMPVMDGMEATRILRGMARFADLPIVALTAGAFRSHRDAARSAGMSHFIAKPFDIPRTIDLIRHLTDAGAGRPRCARSIIDVAAGVDIWGDIDTYHHYLRKFAASFAATPETVHTLLAQQRASEAAAALHKLAGAAANVRLMPVSELAGRLERQLADGAPDPITLAQLDATLAAALAEIGRLAAPPAAADPATPTDPAGAAAPACDERAAPLLADLLAACKACNPAPPKRVLAELAPYFAGAALAPIHASIDDFDWRSAERHTRALAGQFHVSI